MGLGAEIEGASRATDRLVALERGGGSPSFTEILPLAELLGLTFEAFASEFQLNLAESRLDFDLMDEGLARDFGSDLEGSFHFDD